MNVLFTADIHIKLGQKNVPVEWAKNRYSMLNQELSELSKKVDLVVIGGDIFDKLPNIEELEIFFELINGLQAETIIYSGNHEAVKKDTTFLSNLKLVVGLINTKVRIIDDFYSYRGIDFIPYNKLKEWEKDPSKFKGSGNVLCTHVRGEIPPHVTAEIDLELFNSWKVVLAGDLHSHDNCQRNILYPGSPVTTSFHRSKVDTGVIIISTSTFDYKFQQLNLPQLIRKTIKVGEPLVPGDFDHIIYEVEGDMSNLSEVESSDLLDKKITKKNNDTALILDPALSLSEEVKEYLLYILELNEDTVKDVLSELSAYATT